MNQQKDLEEGPWLALRKACTLRGIFPSEATLRLLWENNLEVTEKGTHPQFPVSPGDLKEGMHFYLVGGRWVFTEYYHLLRGYCCNNNCRHCVYVEQPKH